MKLIIDIPDSAYDFLSQTNDAIANGTPLEKHDEQVIKETVESIWGKPPCNDAISRQAVLDCQQIFYDNAGYKTYYVDIEDIKDLPPVYPQPKTGHWVKKSKYSNDYCSECGYELLMYGKPKFCPNCGARMKSEE